MTRGIKPEIGCPCAGAHRVRAFEYNARPAAETKFDFGSSPYQRTFDRCAACGHWFGSHELDLSTLYDTDYVDKTYGGRDGMAAKLSKILALPREKSDNAGRVDRLCAIADALIPAPAGRRVLDVGAGLGVFPAAMKARGWSVVALEPDARTVAHLRENVGVEALAQPLESLTVSGAGRFALITFNKVLEHVERPVEMLKVAAGLLEPGGLVYVEVPDGAAAARDPDGPNREEFFIEHHHVFSAASLALMTNAAGLTLMRMDAIREPSSKYTLWSIAGKA